MAKSEREEFMVSLVLFPSLEAREEYQKYGYGRMQVRMVFYGHTERWAAVRFYRACKQAHTDPLIQGVTMYHNGELVAWASSGRSPTFKGLAF